jgi:ppGpp synthetase/RelA/SpoT-type nucleotidyltranferase
VARVKPLYSREKVNIAGSFLIGKVMDGMTADECFAIINNWRSIHNAPLDTFQKRLRRMAKNIDQNSIVAQRIKRLPSIFHKLDRFPKMKLTQIQDIAGCRAILSSVTDVETLVGNYVNQESRGVKHILATKDDYIQRPRTSGYRGVHLVYKYRSDKKSQDYKDLKIEIQIRTFLQHAWATAVETVSTFFKQALKSSQGDEEWLRFFELMGSAMAIKEDRPLIANTPQSFRDLKREIVFLEKKLDVEGHLKTFRDSLSVFDEDKSKRDAHYYLLELDVASRRILIKSYQQSEIVKATEDYIDLERRNSNNPTTDAVLVSADSIDKLRIAYPNYYLDTALFLEAVREIKTSKSYIQIQSAKQIALPFK